MNTTQQDPEVLYKDCEKILNKLAWDAASRYPITYEEALSEAHWGFMKALRMYNPDKGMRFTSFVYFIAWTRIKDLVMSRSADPVSPVGEITENMAGETPPTECPSLDVVQELGEDARLLVQMLLEIPEDLIGIPLSPKRLLSQVKKLLRQKGWTRNRVEQTVEQVRTALQTAWAG